MLLTKFKQIQKLTSDFRSEALFSNYQNSINLYHKLLSKIKLIKQQSSQNIRKEINSLEEVINKECNLIKQLKQSYEKTLEKPIIVKTSEQNQQKVVIQQNKQIKKWKSTNNQFRKPVSNRILEQNNSTVTFQNQQIQNLLKNSLQTNITERFENIVFEKKLKEQIQQKILLPLLLPKFYKRQKTRIILIYGNQGMGKKYLTKAIAYQTKSRLFEARLQDYNQRRKAIDYFNSLLEITKIPLNTIFALYNIEKLDIEILGQVNKFLELAHQNIYTNSTIIITSDQPWKIYKIVSILNFDLKLSVNLLDQTGRKQLISRIVNDQKHINIIKNMTENYNTSDIIKISNKIDKEKRINLVLNDCEKKSDKLFKIFEQDISNQQII